jgi:mannose-1-phosphate guanylyltransferase/mannose-6-phosphate isomerase
MSTSIVAAILCGGAGARLWPLSTPARPKQFHALVGQETLFEETLRRLAPIAPNAPILAITGGQGLAHVAAAAAHTGLSARVRTWVEPAAKNTFAPALLAAHATLAEAGSDGLVLLAPADHHVARADEFARAVMAAAPLAQDGRLVTFGVRPDAPHTGYGYIERGDQLGVGYAVARFREKPDRATAESFLAQGGFDWNAGIFLYRADWFLAEAARHAPETAAAVAQAFAGRSESPGQAFAPQADAWATIVSDSIDYAMAEKTDRRAVVPVDIGWSDVGSFATLYALADKDVHANAVRGSVVLREANGNYVRAETGRPVAVIGLDDLIVVDAPEGLIIVPRARAEEIKHIVAELAQRNRPNTD